MSVQSVFNGNEGGVCGPGDDCPSWDHVPSLLGRETFIISTGTHLQSQLPADSYLVSSPVISDPSLWYHTESALCMRVTSDCR